MGELYVQIKVIHTTRYSLSYYGYTVSVTVNWTTVSQSSAIRTFAPFRSYKNITRLRNSALAFRSFLCVHVCTSRCTCVSAKWPSSCVSSYASFTHRRTEERSRELERTDGHTSNASNSERIKVLIIIVSAWYFIQNRTSSILNILNLCGFAFQIFASLDFSSCALLSLPSITK